MSRMKIKDLYNLVDSPFIFDENMEYPIIEGNESNFLTYYDDNKEQFDRFFVHEYGQRYVDFDSEEEQDIKNEWQDELLAIQRMYLDSWARLWYALNIDFNPVYNVEEHISTTYGEDVTTNNYGQHQRTDNYAQKQTTDGEHTDTMTNYSVSFDNTTEKETGKNTDLYGQHVMTEAAHIDTHTDAAAEDSTTRDQHTDTVDRSGNIGVVSATNLVKQEIELRGSYAFFKNCFLVIINELGAYWDDAPCFM